MLDRLVTLGLKGEIQDPFNTLDKVKELNSQGKGVIFAMSHLKPQSVIKQKIAVAEDFPFFRKLLNESGIDGKMIFRGDGDMKLSGFSKSIMNAINRVKSDVSTYLVNGYPVNINKKDRSNAIVQNSLYNLKRILDGLDSGENIMISPSGKRFENGVQDFDNNSFNSELGDFYKLGDGNEEYDNGIKRGVFGLSRKTKSPIIPVYSYINEDGSYSYFIGEILSPSQSRKEDFEKLTQYLESMQRLKLSAIKK